MIVVRVELHSAVTGKVTELARMLVANTGTGTAARGNYRARTLRGRSRTDLDRGTVQREGLIEGHPRRLHVWRLVARALARLGYGEVAERDMEAA